MLQIGKVVVECRHYLDYRAVYEVLSSPAHGLSG
jgi:hypothetical protein